jgi:hypothetical protein
MQTAFKPVTNLSCTSAARGDGASPGRNVRCRIVAPGIRDGDILLDGENQPADNLVAVEQARARGA